MSSTNRKGSQRKDADFYITPPWTVHRLLERIDLPGGRWLEPCAGDGTLIRAINEKRPDVSWSAGELREEMRSSLEDAYEEQLRMGDFLETELSDWSNVGDPFDVIVTNPPYSLAMPFVKKCMSMSKLTVMLLRLNFWGSETRQSFMLNYPPDTYVLPNRPVFALNQHGKPGVDSPEYAWFVFHSQEFYANAPSDYAGKIQILGTTSKQERKLWNERVKQHALASLQSSAEQQLSDASLPGAEP